MVIMNKLDNNKESIIDLIVTKNIVIKLPENASKLKKHFLDKIQRNLLIQFSSPNFEADLKKISARNLENILYYFAGE